MIRRARDATLENALLPRKRQDKFTPGRARRLCSD